MIDPATAAACAMRESEADYSPLTFVPPQHKIKDCHRVQRSHVYRCDEARPVDASARPLGSLRFCQQTSLSHRSRARRYTALARFDELLGWHRSARSDAERLAREAGSEPPIVGRELLVIDSARDPLTDGIRTAALSYGGASLPAFYAGFSIRVSQLDRETLAEVPISRRLLG